MSLQNNKIVVVLVQTVQSVNVTEELLGLKKIENINSSILIEYRKQVIFFNFIVRTLKSDIDGLGSRQIY